MLGWGACMQSKCQQHSGASSMTAADIDCSHPPPPLAPLTHQDLARLRQLAAVRGLVSTELRARLWPILVGGCEAPASAHQPQSPSSASHALVVRRSSAEGRASSPAALGSPGAVALPCASGGPALSSEYKEWASGTHKDKGTVSCCANRLSCQRLAATVSLSCSRPRLFPQATHTPK